MARHCSGDRGDCIGWFVVSPFVGRINPAKESAIVTEAVNVRQGPGVAYPKSGKPLPKGASVEVLERKEGWVKIGDGHWIAEKYTRP